MDSQKLCLMWLSTLLLLPVVTARSAVLVVFFFFFGPGVTSVKVNTFKWDEAGRRSCPKAQSSLSAASDRNHLDL